MAAMLAGKNNKPASSLGTKFYFYVNSAKKKLYCIVIQPGRLVTWLETKNTRESSKPGKSGRHIGRVSGRSGTSDSPLPPPLRFVTRPRSPTNSSNMATGFAGPHRTLARIQTTACKQAI